jgi:hypothetical protein
MPREPSDAIRASKDRRARSRCRAAILPTEATWPIELSSKPAGVATATADLARQQAWQEFTIARRWGITGFPALLVRDGTELALVTKGCGPAEPLVDAVVDWLAERPAPEIDGAACAIDGPAC